MSQKIIIGLVLIVAVIGTGNLLLSSTPEVSESITSYEECVAAGYPILESYPEQCKTPDGRSFTRKIVEEKPTSLIAVLNKSFVLRIGENAVFSNGLSLTLKEINDSRCKPDVQCFWQGELSPLLSMTSSGVTKELRLGTVNNKSVDSMGYLIALESATTESVNMIVTPSSSTIPPSISSGVSGYIHLGPTCPVMRTPPDSGCGDRAYAGARIAIKKAIGGSVVSQSVSDDNGNFKIVVSPGAYTVEVSPMNNNILPRCDTKEVVVLTGTFTNIDVSCDSGIR